MGSLQRDYGSPDADKPNVGDSSWSLIESRSPMLCWLNRRVWFYWVGPFLVLVPVVPLTDLTLPPFLALLLVAAWFGWPFTRHHRETMAKHERACEVCGQAPRSDYG